MGLILHTPFIKDYTTETIQDSYSTVSSTSAVSIASGGPFGKYLNINNGSLSYTPGWPANCRELSIAFWFNPTYSGTTWNDVIRLSTRREISNTDAAYRIEYDGGGYTLFNNGHLTDSGGACSVGTQQALPSGTWSHVCLTTKIEGKVATHTIYINGVQKGSRTYTGDSTFIFHGSISIGDSAISFGMSDLRIYDNVLSIYEINQLQKKPLLYYSFDNYLPINEFKTLIGNSMGSGGTLSELNPDIFKLTADGTATSSTGLWIYMVNSTNQLTPSTSYVFSADVYNASDNADVNIIFEQGSSLSSSNYKNGGRITCTDKYKWTRIWGVFTTGANAVSGSIMFYPNPYSGAFTSGYQLYKNIKLYKGTEYAEGGSSDVIRDESTMGMDSIKTTAIPTNESRFGNTCVKFEGSQFIALPPEIKISGPMSYNIWAYMDDWSQYVSGAMRMLSCTESGGFNIEYTSAGKIVFAVYDSGTGYKNMNLTEDWASLSSGWHMFTMTFDGTYAKAYVDGTLRKTSVAFTSGKIGYHASNSLFLGAEAAGSAVTPGSNYFKGKLDSFKMWASTLSDTEVSLLYNKVASIDNTGKLYSKHLTEKTLQKDVHKITTGSPTVTNYVYTGAAQSVSLPAGTYILECWGANGGDGRSLASTITTAVGGKGGYSKGTLTLNNTTTIYISVGGAGTSSATAHSGGWNGGGDATVQEARNQPYGSGGGASDIRVLTNSLYNRIIVAGGGGGAPGVGSGTPDGSDLNGGHGGGLSGEDGGISYSSSHTSGPRIGGGGGSQSSGGAAGTGKDSTYTGNPGTFGMGGDWTNAAANSFSSGAGGGGWYGGGSGAAGGTAGGGGSGYVNTSSSVKPSGYFSAYASYYLNNANTYKITESGFIANPDTSGNGYIRITKASNLSSTVIPDQFKSSSELVDMIDVNSTTISQVSRVDDLYLGESVYEFNTGYCHQEFYTIRNAPIYNHKYYAMMLWKTTSGYTVGDSRFEYYLDDSAGGQIGFFTKTQDTKGEWVKLSNLIQITTTPRDPGVDPNKRWRIRNFVVNATQKSWCTGIRVIDLTETFGAGNEPDLTWCNNNIHYTTKFAVYNSDQIPFVDEKGIITPKGTISELGRKMRYLKLYCNGSNANAYHHIQRVKVTTIDGEVKHLCVPVGSTTQTRYNGLISGSINQNSTDCAYSLTFDLGREYIITDVTVGRYYADSRKYYQQSVRGSTDNSNWFTIYDSCNTDTFGSTSNTGLNLYSETFAGRKFDIPAVETMITQNGIVITNNFIEE